MFRKYISLLLTVLFLLSLAGCSPAPTVAVCLAADTALSSPLEEGLRAQGYTLQFHQAGLDQSVQTRQVEQCLEEGCDLLILDPVMQDLAGETLAMCRDAAVPVILLGDPPPEDWDRVCCIPFRPEDAGTLLGQSFAALPSGGDLNGDGKVSYVLLSGPEDHLDAAAITEACTAAAGRGCLAVSAGPWTREQGASACRKLLQQYGKDVEVVLCQSDALAYGVLDGIQDNGRTPGEDIHVVSVGGEKQARLLVRSGDLSGLVAVHTDACVRRICDAAALLLEGDMPASPQYGDHLLLTRENIEDHI